MLYITNLWSSHYKVYTLTSREFNASTKCEVYDDNLDTKIIVQLDEIINSKQEFWGTYKDDNGDILAVFVCTPQDIGLINYLEYVPNEMKSMERRVIGSTTFGGKKYSRIFNYIPEHHTVITYPKNQYFSIWHILLDAILNNDSNADIILDNDYLYLRRYTEIPDELQLYESNDAYVFKCKPTLKGYIGKVMLDLV